MCGKLWPIVATILPGDQIRLACVHRQGRAWKVVTLIICHILLLLLKCDHFQRINKMCTGSRSWLLFCAPERWQSHCSVYRAAELEHILCTASWSQVAKCVPIHSLNITTHAPTNMSGGRLDQTIHCKSGKPQYILLYIDWGMYMGKYTLRAPEGCILKN